MYKKTIKKICLIIFMLINLKKYINFYTAYYRQILVFPLQKWQVNRNKISLLVNQ
jgi:hypothetical protein